MNNRRKRNEDSSEDWPTYSRLFIVCERNMKEEQFRDAFSKFGEIEDIRIPRDRNTGEPRGVVYLKFYKTSDAAYALEEMHLKTLPDSNRPLKVMVAANRSEIQSDDEDSEKYKRLFINIAKTEDENSLHETFSKYGNVEMINIQKDRNSGESKGFAYVKYRKFSEAAVAFEECDKKYRAIFALPKGHRNRHHETAFESNINNLAMSSMSKTPLITLMNTNPEGYTHINFMCAPYLSQHHVRSLFNIVPGMVECKFFVDLVRNHGKGTVKYSNPISASYAVEKLNNFEYPPGMKVFVKPDNTHFDSNEKTFSNLPNAVGNLRNAIAATSNSAAPDLAQLAEAIAEASKLIKLATKGISDENIPDASDLNYCSVKLPNPKPLADIDSKVAKRCFLVCKPHPPSVTVLRDVFCRFGDLINVYTLPNKTVGYVRYASVQAADDAIKTLHGSEICGVRIKVLEAEEKPDDTDEASSKRAKYGH